MSNRRPLLVRFIISALLVGAWQAISAEESPVAPPKPAQWLEGPNAFSLRLRCPDDAVAADGTITALCHAKISILGRVTSYACFTKLPSQYRYSNVASRALKKIKYSPATAAGHTETVLAYAAAFFTHKEGECTAYGSPNWGLSVESFGTGYIAPQEFITDSNWTSKSRSVLRHISNRAHGKAGVAFMLKAEMSVDGTPSNVQFIPTNMQIKDKSQEKITAAYRESQFIPGYFDGQPKAMPVVRAYTLDGTMLIW